MVILLYFFKVYATFLTNAKTLVLRFVFACDNNAGYLVLGLLYWFCARHVARQFLNGKGILGMKNKFGGGSSGPSVAIRACSAVCCRRRQAKVCGSELLW